MKNRIVISYTDNMLHFYLHGDMGCIYLFTQHYTKGVYEFFRGGRAETELFKFKHWDSNSRLSKTIEKIPLYINYAMKEYAA